MKSHPVELQEIYALITARSPSTPANKTKPHPMFAFRFVEDEPEDEENEVPEDEVSEILAYFAGDKAVLLYSDGTNKPASKYEPGPNGFAIAHFAGSPTTLELEIPKTLIAPDGLSILIAVSKPVPKAKKKSTGVKKPASANSKAKAKAKPTSVADATPTIVADEKPKAKPKPTAKKKASQKAKPKAKGTSKSTMTKPSAPIAETLLEEECDVEEESSMKKPSAPIAETLLEEECEMEEGSEPFKPMFEDEEEEEEEEEDADDEEETNEEEMEPTEPPLKKSKTIAPVIPAGAWSAEKQQAILASLPDQAKPADALQPTQKSFTQNLELGATIGVLLNLGSYYVSPVTTLPDNLGEGIDLAINKKAGVQVCWSKYGGPKSAWLLAMRVADQQ